MAFKKGQARPKGSGRQKGSLNKRSEVAEAILKFHDFSIFNEWVHLYRSLGDSLDESQLKHSILTQMAPFVHPKLTTIKVEKTPEETALESLTTPELIERAREIVLKQGVGYEKLEKEEPIPGQSKKSNK